MAVKDPAVLHAEHRVTELKDQRKQIEARYAAELMAYHDATDAIDAELAAWERLLNPLLTVEAPAAKKAASPKK